MSSKPREWPNVAKEARDRAAEEALHGLKEMKPLLYRNCSETQIFQIAGRVNDSLHEIVRLLESVGAQTRPF